MIAGLFFLATAASFKLDAGVTPIQKVIQMMQEMVAKGKQEKHDEMVAFSTFSQFCKDTMDEKQAAIKKAKASIEQLSADIMKAQADQTQLADEIAALGTEMDAWEKDQANLTAERESEKADFDALQADYDESIDALKRAIAVLKKEQGKTPQSLLEVQKVKSLKMLPMLAKRTLLAFLNSDAKQDPLSVSAPQAAAYESQSGGVVEMLEKLLDKFRAELDGYQKEEMNSKFNYQTLYQELVSNIDEATASSELKTKVKAERAQDEAAAKGDLEVTKKDLAADESYLSDLISECDAKSKAYENRQMLRMQELEAIGKAIEIIQSPDVMGTGEKHLPQFIQLKAKTTTSMSLLRSNQDAPIRAKLISFLSSRAKETKSKLLLMLASKAAAGGPFDKVKKMIKDLIVKLMEEATEESEHKGWCDTEMGTNKQTREDKADQVSTLTAESEELSAKISKLSEEMAALSDDIAAIDRAVAEATALRQKEKEKNTVTIEEAKVAQAAVAKAIAVLEEFYAKAADATSLAQMDQPEGISDKPYTGMGGASGGIIGMLQVIESDFARLETETSSSEEQAEEEYTKFTDDSAQDKAVKNMDLENKGKDKTTAESDLVTTKSDLEATQKELDAALAYYEKLKPSCVDAGLSYEERVRMREEEIQSLQESLKILGGEDI
jgi:predicted  nucleic acid-binding Zn-ribbon protein